MTTSSLNRYRTYCVLEVGRKLVLHYILTSGTNKPPGMRIDDYLQNLPSSSTANYRTMNSKCKKFNKTERDQIERDPTCASFDITLTCKIINFACEGFMSADIRPMNALEHCVVSIKDWRNECHHGSHEITFLEYQEISGKLKTLFHDALRAAEQRYKLPSVNVNAKADEVDRELQKIDSKVLGKEDLLLCCGPELKVDLISETDSKLRGCIEAACCLNPVSFLLGLNVQIDVLTVFTEVRVMEGSRGGNGTVMSHKDVVSTARQLTGHTQPQILLVRGQAGSGKTTLISMIAAEWLKDSQDRTITGLDHYSLLLQVQCRDRGVTSLEQLLQNMMPVVYMKFRELLLPLLKTCSVLFIIDGLDEANKDSTKLIDNILQCSQGCNDWTIFCSSRPEGLSKFESRIPSHCNKTYIELLGVSTAQRETFVERYHQEIQLKTGNKQDTRQFLEKVRNMLKLDHFRLPLNMLFLTWICLKRPDVITTSMTQTQLYLSSYELCIERLVHRVTPRVTVPEHDLRSSLNECVNVLQKECLLALSDLQISVKGESEGRIRKACNIRDVPVDDVLSSFFSLREFRSVIGVLEKQYMIPHKSLLEFYAALFVVEQLSLSTITGGIKAVLQRALLSVVRLAIPSTVPGGIKAVLQDSLGLPHLEAPRFLNTLRYVAGLLHQPSKAVPDYLSTEVVDLMKESGVEWKDEWLDLIEETNAATPIVKRVVKYFPAASGAMIDGSLRITDSRVWSYAILLQHLPPSEVHFRLERDWTGRETEFGDLIKALGKHKCTRLYLQHHYQHPDASSNSDYLLHVLPRCQLEWFLGHLSVGGIELLQDCHRLKLLRLAVCDDRDTPAIVSRLCGVKQTFPDLSSLWLHVPVTRVTPHLITTPLPDIQLVELVLSEVDECLLEKVCRIASALQPKTGYPSIRLPGCKMDVNEWRRLFILLSDAGVTVWGVGMEVDDKNTMTRDEESELNDLAKTRGLTGLKRRPEDLLWWPFE